jgi:hypothetical protein
MWKTSDSKTGRFSIHKKRALTNSPGTAFQRQAKRLYARLSCFQLTELFNEYAVIHDKEAP